MCKWGTDELVDVTVSADVSHTGEAYVRAFGIDACIAPIVRALNAGGIVTRQSCCGHGAGPGRIDLNDGRVLFIATPIAETTNFVRPVEPARLESATTIMTTASADDSTILVAEEASVPAPAIDGSARECEQWRKLRASKPAVPYLLYFPSMREVARRHGYALAIHGSLTRDFDLVAVPWTLDAAEPDALVEAICADNQLLVTVPDRGDKPHGRRCWTLQGIAGVGHGWVDLSVFSPRPAAPTTGETP